MTKRKRDADELPPREVVTVVDETEAPDGVPCSGLDWARGAPDRVSSKTAADWEASLRGYTYGDDYGAPDFVAPANDPSRGDRMRFSNPLNYVPFVEDDDLTKKG